MTAARQRESAPLRCLNLGCGSRYVPGWTNVDMAASGPGVLVHDLRTPLPFPDDSFDLAYHSHVLEHFSRADGENLLRECVRVLRPGGILRVVVPDLEQIARRYLEALERAAAEGGEERAADYDWVILMLYDQAMRDTPGGMMARYLQQSRLVNEEFVLKSCGSEMARVRALLTGRAPEVGEPSAVPRREGPIRRFLRRGSAFLGSAAVRREALARRILGEEYADLIAIRFRRRSGEIHQWMYDRYSLSRLMGNCGLIDLTKRGATDSAVEGWGDLHLDTDPDGAIYKPESLFMEGTKPSASS